MHQNAFLSSICSTPFWGDCGGPVPFFGANIFSAFFPGCARVYTYVAHVSYASFPHLNKNMTHTRLIIGGGVSMCHLQQVPGTIAIFQPGRLEDSFGGEGLWTPTHVNSSLDLGHSKCRINNLWCKVTFAGFMRTFWAWESLESPLVRIHQYLISTFTSMKHELLSWMQNVRTSSAFKSGDFRPTSFFFWHDIVHNLFS